MLSVSLKDRARICESGGLIGKKYLGCAVGFVMLHLGSDKKAIIKV